MYQELRKRMRVLSIEKQGVHIVAEWTDGGSDSGFLPIHTEQQFKSEFPEAADGDVSAFFRGERGGFIVRRWTDEHNRDVVDRVYWTLDEHEFDGKAFLSDELTFEGEDEGDKYVISLTREHYEQHMAKYHEDRGRIIRTHNNTWVSVKMQNYVYLNGIIDDVAESMIVDMEKRCIVKRSNAIVSMIRETTEDTDSTDAELMFDFAWREYI